MKNKNLKMTDDDALRIIMFLIKYLNWGKNKQYTLIDWHKIKKELMRIK